MKILITIFLALILSGFALPENPKLSWGKKCTVQGEQVVWSHLWVYDKEKGLDANKENCELIAD